MQGSTEATLPRPLGVQTWLNELANQMFRKQPPPSPQLPKLIGITGRSGAGKDEIAAYLRDAYGYRVDAFSAGIKAGICAMLDLPAKIWDDRDLKESPLPDYGKSPRELAQTLGTDWGRQLVSGTVWIEAMARRLHRHTGPTVITDVRFNNEAEFLHNLGGLIIQVRRPGQKRIKAHASERGIKPLYVDCVITNDSTVAALRAEVEAILTTYSNAA